MAPSVRGQGGAGGTQSSCRVETVVTPRASWRVTLTKAPWALRRVGRLAPAGRPPPGRIRGLCRLLFLAWSSVAPGTLLKFTEDVIFNKPPPAGLRFQTRTESPGGGRRGAWPAPVCSGGVRGAPGRRGAGSGREARPPSQVAAGGEAGRAARSLGVQLHASSRAGELGPAPRALSGPPPRLENSPRNVPRESCEILSIFIARVGQRRAGCRGGLLAGSRFMGLGGGQRAGLGVGLGGSSSLLGSGLRCLFRTGTDHFRKNHVTSCI